MEHSIIVINSHGQVGVNGDFFRVLNSKSLKMLAKQIDKWNLKSTVIYMSEAEYKDIVAWGREEK